MISVKCSQAMVAADGILVIDDNRGIREALTDVFTYLLDVPVYTAANGYEGLQIYRQQRESVALVLLDMNMPVMNGEETYQELRQIAPHVRVIISSSLSRAEVGHRLGQQQIPTFLPKPYDMDNLLAVVRTELTFVPAEPLEYLVNQPLNGKNGEGNGRSYTEIAFNLPLVDCEAHR